MRACRWAIEQLQREHASVNGLRRSLSTGWRTAWKLIEPPQAADLRDAHRGASALLL
jgi:hypothetical protein